MKTLKKLDCENKKTRLFTFHVFLPLVPVTYTINGVSKRATVKHFKGLIELICGVPTALQRLHYLDMNDLEDSCILTSLEVVNKGTFTLNVWERWIPMIEFIYKMDFKNLVDIFLSDKNCSTDTDVPMISTFENRSETVLFVAAKLGYVELLKILVDLGVNVNSCTTELGYSALHVAIANGQYKCIEFLLENGAKNDTRINQQGKEALRIAEQYGHEYSERYLHLFDWKTRSATSKSNPGRRVDLLRHQQHDSKTPTWFTGSHGTRFMCSTLPYSEFSGTRINAPKVHVVKPPYTSDEEYFSKTDTGSSRLHSYISHQTWLQRKSEEKLLNKQKHQMINQQQKERGEQERKKLLALRRRENEKRTLPIRNALSGRYIKNKTIYDEYTYVPGYSKTILRQYMNDLVLI